MVEIELPKRFPIELNIIERVRKVLEKKGMLKDGIIQDLSLLKGITRQFYKEEMTPDTYERINCVYDWFAQANRNNEFIYNPNYGELYWYIIY